MVLVQKPIKNIYLGGPDPTWEFSYDCRGGSSTGFLEAGGKNIVGNCGFDGNGAYISSSGYDQRFALFVELPDLSTAKKIILEESAYYISGSWSNNKRCGLKTTNTRNDSGYNYFWLEMAYNSSSPGTYNGAGPHLYIDGTETWFPQRYYEGWGTGDIEVHFEIDLDGGTINCSVTGANTKNYTGNLTSNQIATIRTWKYGVFQKEEGYQYRGERLKTLYAKVEY